MKQMLYVQKFISENSDWEKLLQEKPYCITISRDKVFGHNLVMFKYSQPDSDFNNQLVRECRGLILDEDTLEPVCVPFFKFGNFSESYVPDIDWSSAFVSQKLDGCVSYDTLIKTTVGDISIEEICKNPNNYEVLTVNHQTNRIEANKIEAVDIKPNIDNWYEVVLENGTKLTVTGNHKIWCENLQCYRRVDQLDGTEDLVCK